MADMGTRIEQRLGTSSMENEQKLENIRGTVEKRLTTIQEDNNKRLDEMRQIVDEKLQRTINERMTQSFQMVNDRLEQVYKGLGEMQSLAVGVGDLKRVLSNVKTRGYWASTVGSHTCGNARPGAVCGKRSDLPTGQGAGGIRDKDTRG